MKHELRTLVRKRLKYGPDGNSVAVTDCIEVGIIWPEDREPAVKGYDNASEWTLLPAAAEGVEGEPSN